MIDEKELFVIYVTVWIPCFISVLLLRHWMV